MTAESSSDFVVALSGVTKRFGTQTAVSDFSLEIPRGTGLGLLGPNGAGKTTTLKMLMGILRRDAGRISVLGVDPATEDVFVKRRVGYVPEQQFIHRWMRVGEALRFCRTFYPSWNDELCADLLGQFDLDPVKKVRHLSKGMLAKLSLLLAISHEPELLVLDEPMAGLDPVAREEFLDGVLQTICDRGQTLVFSSHTLADVQRMAGTIAIINEGELKVHCRVDDLLKNTKRIRAILTDGATPNSLPEGTVWQRVQDREWLLTVKDFADDTVAGLQAMDQVERVEVIDLGLEDIFKDFVRGWRASA